MTGITEGLVASALGVVIVVIVIVLVLGVIAEILESGRG